MRSFPRQQQYRRLRGAGACAAGSTIAGALTVVAIVLGAILAAGVLVLAAVVLAVRAHHWVRLAGRSRVGARAENEVQRALAPLQAEGWRLRHSLPWRGRGDIDSLAIAPTRVAFVIETKCWSFEPEHLARTREMAVWLGTRRRRWCPRGAIPVLCVVHARGLEQIEHGVLVVSRDRLATMLRIRAGTSDRPAFLAPRGVVTGDALKLNLAGDREVGEDADEEEVGEAVGDRLGGVGCVAVERADRERGPAAGLFGVVDQRRRLGGGRGLV